MEAAYPLRAVPADGEVPEGAPATYSDALLIIDQQNRKLNGAWAENAKLKNQLAQAMGVEPEAEEIVEVLTFWNQTLKGGRCKIVVGSERWLKVRGRLREKDVVTKQRCYSVRHLRAAVVGVTLSEFHIANGHTDAATIFRDSKTVDDHIARAKTFKSTYGVSGLEIVEELAGEGLRWLAEVCPCGHRWIAHIHQGGVTVDGRQPCGLCDCTDFDWFDAKVRRVMAELPVDPDLEARAAACLERGAVGVETVQQRWERKRLPRPEQS